MIHQPHYTKAETIDELAQNFSDIRNKIRAACIRSGRSETSVQLLPVTKTVDERRIRMAHELGYNIFGENKVQECLAKSVNMSDLPVKWSVIGHLQTNKIKYMAKFASEFQALDSIRVAEQLNNRLIEEDRTLNVLVQVNTSGEESKYGLAPKDVALFIQQLIPFSHLRVKGLMTLALLSSESEKV